MTVYTQAEVERQIRGDFEAMKRRLAELRMDSASVPSPPSPEERVVPDNAKP